MLSLRSLRDLAADARILLARWHRCPYCAERTAHLETHVTRSCPKGRIVTRARDALAERIDVGGAWARQTGEDE